MSREPMFKNRNKRNHISSQIEEDLLAVYKTLDTRGLLLAYPIDHIINTHNMTIGMIEEQPIYRVSIHDRTGKVDISCYDLLENFAPELKSMYNNVNDMPTWAQERIAVLMLLDPHTINNDVANVGRRISRNVYWLYKEVENGSNP